MQSNASLYLPIKINALQLECLHMLICPKAVQLLGTETTEWASYLHTAPSRGSLALHKKAI